MSSIKNQFKPIASFNQNLRFFSPSKTDVSWLSPTNPWTHRMLHRLLQHKKTLDSVFYDCALLPWWSSFHHNLVLILNSSQRFNLQAAFFENKWGHPQQSMFTFNIFSLGIVRQLFRWQNCRFSWNYFILQFLLGKSFSLAWQLREWQYYVARHTHHDLESDWDYWWNSSNEECFFSRPCFP